jgi:hypothetical protein
VNLVFITFYASILPSILCYTTGNTLHDMWFWPDLHGNRLVPPTKLVGCQESEKNMLIFVVFYLVTGRLTPLILIPCSTLPSVIGPTISDELRIFGNMS